MNDLEAPANEYVHAIQHSWRTISYLKGEWRLTCDYLENVMIVVTEVVADDVVQAIGSSRDVVFAPLERADLPLPESVVVLASAVSRSSVTGS